MSDVPSGETTARPHVSAMDALIGRPFPVLDDGFVRVVDYMGSDSAIVQAARVSYGAGTKKVQEDRGLIRYLLRHRHTTPFEMCELKLHVRVPMDAWRQWIRHRTANVNEYSTRYSEAIDAAQRTAPEAWRKQSASGKQGSAGLIDPGVGRELSRAEEELIATTRQAYRDRLAAGVAREQARKDLPLSTYTEAYWKVDLHNLLHFLELRMDEQAQLEIRLYADTIGYEIVRVWCPVTWEAFLDYRRGATVLSRIESEILAAVAAGENDRALEIAGQAGWLPRGPDGALLPHRERGEFGRKLVRFSLSAPW